VYNFANNITDTTSLTGAQFSVTVYGSGEDLSSLPAPLSSVSLTSHQVMFVFRNNVGTASSIDDIYFQDGTLLDIASISQTSGLGFSESAQPPDLPGGNNLNPDFQVHSNFVAGSQGNGHGLDSSSDYLGVVYDLQQKPNQPGQYYGLSDVINALNLGISSPSTVWNSNGSTKTGQVGLRIGLHVQAIGTNSQSDSFITTLYAVPEPGTYAMAISAVGLLIGARVLRRRRTAVA
jgi:hypothetical protein